MGVFTAHYKIMSTSYNTSCVNMYVYDLLNFWTASGVVTFSSVSCGEGLMNKTLYAIKSKESLWFRNFANASYDVIIKHD